MNYKMKTIEEKAKAYDEAIDKIGDVVEAGTIEQGLAEWLFPELKESEDEQIRKRLIRHFQHKTKQEWNGMLVKNIIAWLAKQGEQQPVPDWMPKFLDELRSKTKYFDWDEGRDIEGHILAIIEWMSPNYPNHFNGKDDKQKPVWSEKDERIRNFLISKMEEVGNVWKEYSAEDIIAWLEKQGEQKPVSITDEWVEDYWQHEKVNNPYSYDKGEEIQFDHQGFVRFCKKYCKNPAEWSEEDERMRIKILEALSAYADHVQYTGFCINAELIRSELMGWLKSLRPQKR